MLIIQKNNIKYIFLHIPKNCGKYIESQIILNDYTIIHKFWEINIIDIAHIPYILLNNYVTLKKKNIFTFTRNPYDRIISAYFYKNPRNTINDFKHFIINDLTKINFNNKYDYNIIHYYPQYKFLIDSNDIIGSNIKIYKLETYNNDFIILNDFNLIKYDYIKYYDYDSLLVVNNIYEKDFILLNYEKLNMIDTNFLRINCF